MNGNLKIRYAVDDAIAGERIICVGEKLTKTQIRGHSGRHRKQELTVQNGTCWIAKSFRQGILKL